MMWLGLNRRQGGIGLVAIALIGLFIVLLAPTNNRVQSGSTWGYGPDGYAAWYAYMVEQGAAIQRWQRPVSALLDQVDNAAADMPATLLQVRPRPVTPDTLFFSEPSLRDWVQAGHHLIVLGQAEPATAAPFTTQLAATVGPVTIQTRRRRELPTTPGSLPQAQAAQTDNAQTIAPLLSDDYGAVVWRQTAQPDHLVIATTRFLAANAYLDAAGNFAFLADLVRTAEGDIWVDEYLHGYRDEAIVIDEVAGSWLGYLAQTPLLLGGIQAGIVLVIALVAHNRRPGMKKTVQAPRMDEGAAYLQALSGVLHKANSQDFLVETLTRAEQKALQRALGLGDGPVSLDALKTAWHRVTGRSGDQLAVLQVAPRGNAALQTWLEKLQLLTQQAMQCRTRANLPSTDSSAPQPPSTQVPKGESAHE